MSLSLNKHVRKEHSTGNNATQRKTENEEEESNSVERVALVAVSLY